MNRLLFVLIALLLDDSVALRLSQQAAPELELQTDLLDASNARHQPQKRQSKVVQSSFSNGGTVLFVNVSIGTPPQVVGTYLDTSSSDIWVPQGGANGLCSSSTTVQTYDPESSSTFENLMTPFNFTATYANPYTVTGRYAKDTIGFGGVKLSQQQFAIVNDSTECTGGTFGIGYAASEGAAKQYANLPDYMVKQGLINTAAYSMWTSDSFGNSGEILFGGVDTEKFEGGLTTLPIIQQPAGYTQPILALTSMDINGSAIDTNVAGEVILDTGSRAANIFLPEQMVEAIAKTLGGDMDPDTNLPRVNCSAVVTNTSLGFTFTSTRIAVPLSHLIDGSSGGSPEDAGSQCTLGKWLERISRCVSSMTDDAI